jgi:hypothetical protein
VFSRTDMKETLQLNYDRYGDDWCGNGRGRIRPRSKFR